MMMMMMMDDVIPFNGWCHTFKSPKSNNIIGFTIKQEQHLSVFHSLWF